MMAGRALLENEGRDVPVEGDWGCGEREWEDEEENTVDSHGVSFILAGVKLTRSSCLALILLLGLAAHAQQAPANGAPEIASEDSQPTFNTKVNLVLVPVVVRDEQGHAIGNLRREDFKLFDKGKPQTIARFSVEKTTPTSVAIAAAKEPAAIDKNATLIPERFLALVFDDLNMGFGDLVYVQKAATHYLDTDFRATDRAAIFTTSGRTTVDFTSDIAKLKKTIAGLRPQPMYAPLPNQCPDISYYIADRIENKHDQEALGMEEEETHACLNVDRISPEALRNIVESRSMQVLALGEQGTRVALDSLRDIGRRLAAMPGQREMVLVSPGFLTLSTEALEDLTELLNRSTGANIVINALDARGLYTDPSLDASKRPGVNPNTDRIKSEYARADASSEANILAELAFGTGGTFVENTNDLDSGFKRITGAPEYIYVLGFSPQSLKTDGTFHKLQVSLVNGKGSSVQYRRGYYAPTHAVSEQETAKAEIQDAVFSRDEIRDFPIDLHTQYFKPDPADAKLTVLARVDIKHLRFRKEADRYADNLTVVSALFDPNGNFVTGSEKTITMRLRDQTLARLDNGITVKSSFDVKPGAYLVRLVVRDAQGQTMAAQNGAVDIP